MTPRFTYRFTFGLVAAIVVGSTVLPTSAAAGSLDEYKEETYDDDTSEEDEEEEEEEDDSSSSDSSDSDGTSVAGEIFGSLLSGLLSGAAEGDEGGDDDSDDEGDTDNCRYREFHTCRAQCDRSPSECRKSCRRYANHLCGYAFGGSIKMGSSHSPAFRATGEMSSNSSFPSPFYHINWNRPSSTSEFGVGFSSDAALLSAGSRLRWRYYGLGLRTSLLGSRDTWLLEGDVGPAFSFPLNSTVLSLQPSFLFTAGKDEPTLPGGGGRIYLDYYGPRLLIGTSLMLGYVGGNIRNQIRIGLGYRFTPLLFVKIGYDFRLIQEIEVSDPHRVTLQGGLISFGVRMN